MTAGGYDPGVMAEPQWLDEREQCAWRAFIVMRRRLDYAMNRQLVADAGLSTADYELLVPLSEAPDQRLRAGELRRAVDWEKSRLSHQVRRMEERGLVRRESCASDARSSIIRLTPAGWDAIKAAAPAHVEWLRRYFIGMLSAEELSTLQALSTRVVDALGACPEELGDDPEQVTAPGAEEDGACPAELGAGLEEVACD